MKTGQAASFVMPDKSVLFHTVLGKKRRSYYFTKPVTTITCHDGFLLLKAVAKLEKYISLGYYAAGYLSYEAGAILAGSKTGPVKSSTRPLLKFGIFRKPVVYDNLDLKGGMPAVYAVKADTKAAEYGKKFRRIKRLIDTGEVYQVNFCFKISFDIAGTPEELFSSLCKKQPVKYAALLKDKTKSLISMSPELFFEVEDRNIIMKPMKGTLLKPCKPADVRRFKKDPKTSAENVMIVDLIRNDLGRICEVNSIKLDNMFAVEEYDTLYQMTSTVRGKLKKETGISAILSALFPSGSVTGAPKIRAMQIINEMEKTHRGIYTGAIGFITPRMKRAVFNIPIRTAELDGDKGTYGIGSGIVHDSAAAGEYAECLGKAAILKPDFKLIESLLYRNGNFFLRQAHLNRMKKSAGYFKFPFSLKKAKSALGKASKMLSENHSYKVRLLLDCGGNFYAESGGIKDENISVVSGVVSGVRVNSGSMFLRHKTTNRALYDKEYKKYHDRGFGEVLFFNEKNELTEAHSSNIFIEKDGIFYTPPVSCGVLPGTYREYLLKKRANYREKVLYMKDLKNANAVYICNSVRGFRRLLLRK